MSIFHIFAGGELTSCDFIDIAADDTVICADSGYAHVKAAGITPHIIVGDFDSYTGEIPDNAEIHTSVPEKDDTDTMLSLKIAVGKGAKQVKIYGALGGRFDHTFANIQTLEYAMDNGCCAQICSEDNVIMLLRDGIYEFEKWNNWYFSVFAYTPEVIIEKLSGVKYPLENKLLTSGFPLGVSNEITDEKAHLTVKNGSVLIIRSKM